MNGVMLSESRIDLMRGRVLQRSFCGMVVNSQSGFVLHNTTHIVVISKFISDDHDHPRFNEHRCIYRP